MIYVSHLIRRGLRLSTLVMYFKSNMSVRANVGSPILDSSASKFFVTDDAHLTNARPKGTSIETADGKKSFAKFIGK